MHALFADGSWFLPHQPIYPAVTTVQITPCERYQTSGNSKRHRSSPYPTRPKSTSISPPPHGIEKMLFSIFKKFILNIFSVYNPPDHVQQSQLYNNPSSTPTYTSWSTIPPQTPTTIMNSTINCWSLTTTPPPPHQISAQTTPNQSPTHQIYQPITNLTNLSYSTYYNQDVAYTHYQSPEYVPLMNTDVTYSERQSSYTEDIEKEDATYDDTTGSLQNNHPDSPESNSSTPRHEWTTQNHV